MVITPYVRLISHLSSVDLVAFAVLMVSQNLTRRQENKRIFNLHAKPVSETLLRTWLLLHMSHDLLTGVPPGFA